MYAPPSLSLPRRSLVNRYFSMNLVLLVSMIMLQGGVAVEVVEGGVVEVVEDRYIVIQLLVAVHFGQCLSKFCVFFHREVSVATVADGEVGVVVGVDEVVEEAVGVVVMATLMDHSEYSRNYSRNDADV